MQQTTKQLPRKPFKRDKNDTLKLIETKLGSFNKAIDYLLSVHHFYLNRGSVCMLGHVSFFAKKKYYSVLKN